MVSHFNRPGVLPRLERTTGILNRLRSWVADKIDPRHPCERGGHDYGEWRGETEEFHQTITLDGRDVSWRVCEECGHREFRKETDKNFPSDVNTASDWRGDTDQRIYNFGNVDITNIGRTVPTKDHTVRWGENRKGFLITHGGRNRVVRASSHEQALQKYVAEWLSVTERIAEKHDDHREWNDDSWVHVRELGVEMKFTAVLKDHWNGSRPMKYDSYYRDEHVSESPNEL